jgi:hypothetical protein
VRLEGLGKLKKQNDHVGSRTLDLPACSIAPQPFKLSRNPSAFQLEEQMSVLLPI